MLSLPIPELAPLFWRLSFGSLMFVHISFTFPSLAGFTFCVKRSYVGHEYAVIGSRVSCFTLE